MTSPHYLFTLPESPAALLADAGAAITESQAHLDRLLGHAGARSRKDTLEPYHALLIRLGNASNRAGLLSEVHPDAAMREAAETATQQLSAFMTDLSLHRGLYDALAAVPLNGEDAVTTRLVERTLKDFRRSGVDRDETTRTRLKALAEQAVKLGQAFDRNIRDDVRSISIRPEQLKGLPQDYIDSHPPGADGKVTVTTDYPDAVPVRKYAEDASVRKALSFESLNRAYPVNLDVFKSLLRVRKEQAQLLGFASWADYATEDKMIEKDANIASFVDKISKLTEGRARKDYALLLARKQKDVPDATDVKGYEQAFYEDKVMKESHAYDSQAMRPYFEFERCKQGLLTLTAKLFGIEYRKVEGPKWHPDVDVYEVHSAQGPVGKIYLDLHPRPAKYKHAAQFPLVSGVKGKQLPEGALICNFADPKVVSPALLDHDSVVTMFHEFGHLMHHVLGGHVDWVSHSGVATEWDFVEAPSQMFEEWAWDPATLATFAKHVETGKPISAEEVQRMRAASNFGEGIRVRTQTYYAELARRYHSDDPETLDVDGLMRELQNRLSLFAPMDDTHFYASFGHLNGYSALYYTYLWSLVIAKDLLSEFKAKGLNDSATAARYRDTVLARGGTRDAAELVKDFLGRPYAFDAFAKWLNA